MKSSGYQPRRTLRLVLWTNEENGLAGAKSYVDRHREELASHSAVIESDWGIGPVAGFAISGGAKVLEELVFVQPWLASVRAGQLRPGTAGSDMVPFERQGVPVMDLATERKDDFWFHHTAADTVDKVDPAELNRCVAVEAVMLYALGEMPELLSR